MSLSLLGNEEKNFFCCFTRSHNSRPERPVLLTSDMPLKVQNMVDFCRIYLQERNGKNVTSPHSFCVSVFIASQGRPRELTNNVSTITAHAVIS